MRISPLVFLSLVLFWGSVPAAEPWTLDRALAQALENSPDARIAKARIAAARAGIAQADALVWPRLQFQSSYTRTDNPMQVFGGILNQRSWSQDLDFNDVPDLDNLNVKGLLTMPVYSGGRTRASRQSARSGAAAANLEMAAITNLLAFEVTRAYNTVLKSSQVITAAQSSVDALQKSLEISQKRLAAGGLLKTDVLDLEVKLAHAREDVVRARNSHALSLRVLKNLIGLQDQDFTVADEYPSITVPESKPPRRVEVDAARQREQAAESQLLVSRSAYKPQVSGFGSIDYDRGWKTDGDGTSYTVGALLQWDIWDGKLTRARVAEKGAELEAAREQTRRTELALDLELQQAQLDLKASRERLAVTESAIQQASESAGLVQRRFEQGQALSTAVIDAESALVIARVRRAEAESDLRIAIAALRKALGYPQTD